ncbi:cyclase [Bordetella genomosp. 10]|uniref:Cyclase n=1 Tax=Bordetella genomosp. 10 TaxID=1416804 RepID=A0A261SME4_9BORD|nr:cyclase family protein [Bordetella genomosp. 10]OZI38594.1 cyclase [Bordetella genomosp. 10]
MHAPHPRWRQRPPGSNWGDFGPDDQRGRMNWVDRGKVLQGIAEVREGLTFCLSLPLDYPGGTALNPKRQPPRRYATLRDGASAGKQSFCFSYADEDERITDVVCDDAVLMSLQYSTQWDSLAHIGSRFDADGDGRAEAVFYNGYRAGVELQAAREDTQAEPWARFPEPTAHALGIENLAEHGAQGRGVMLDLHRHFGDAQRRVGYDDLMRVLEADAVEIERGDMVCVHTGFAQLLLDMRKQPRVDLLKRSCSALDGHDARLLDWISDSGLACLVADNPAVEAVHVNLQPGIRAPRLPLHEHCLFKNGIHLGELWYLTPLARWLAAHGRTRFLLTAPPLRLPGAAGSPATPIATV